MSDSVGLTARFKAEAWRLGFDLCRILPLSAIPRTDAPHADFFAQWVAAGSPAEMSYLARHLEKRRTPALLADRTHGPFAALVVLGVDYHQAELPAAVRADPSRGIIAAYAWGDDYHDLIRPRLHALEAWLRGQTGRSTRGKGLVDTGPVLERDWAAVAGLGFTGKNCCTIHPALGSWLFLATLLVPDALVCDAPPTPPAMIDPAAALAGLPWAADYGRTTIPLDDGASAVGTCGRCTRCGDACPTDAFVGPYHLDPRRCIAYWTIETQSPIPRALRPRFGNRIFGCDICQEVCPWNRRLPDRAPRIPELAARAERLAPPLLAGFASAHPYWRDEAAFAAHFAGSPILRAGRAGMARNVCVALGNWGAAEAVPPLVDLLYHDPAPVVRGHAAWALGQIGAAGHAREAIRAALDHAAATERDAGARDDLAALG